MTMRKNCRVNVLKVSRCALLFIASSLLMAPKLRAQVPDKGKKTFESICGRCHGGDGNGGEMGPPILTRLRSRNDEQLRSLIHNGLPSRGMPPSGLDDSAITDLLAYLRVIQ